MDAGPPATEAQLLRASVELIRARLPQGWTLTSGVGSERAVRSGVPDATFELSAPDARKVGIDVEVKQGVLAGREALGLAQSIYASAVLTRSVPLLVARYLSPQVREQLQKVGVSYADATGNLMLSAIDPGIYLADRGEDSDPWRTPGRPRGTLKGDPAARVVRCLLDFSHAWKIRDLIDTSGASTGATYRVLEYLEREGLADREDSGRWVAPDWERLARAWADDYNFLTENSVTRYIEPRGLDRFAEVLAGSDRPYALTGAAAAEDQSSISPTRSVFVYVDDAVRSAEAWGLRPTDAGVNVVLLEPRKPRSVVFARTAVLANGVTTAAPAQVVVDVLNGPGRDPQEGEELLRWMTGREAAWRIQ